MGDKREGRGGEGLEAENWASQIEVQNYRKYNTRVHLSGRLLLDISVHAFSARLCWKTNGKEKQEMFGEKRFIW